MKEKKIDYTKSRWSIKEPLYLNPKDRRYKKAKIQLKKLGFCDSETWGLDSVISEFIYPRLRRFRQIDAGFPGGMTSEEWTEILDKMIFAFEWNLTYNDLDYDEQNDIKTWKKYDEGMNLFAKYFRNLWW